SIIGVQAIQAVVAGKDRVIAENAASLITATKLQGSIESRVASFRGYLLGGTEEHLQRLTEADAGSAQALASLKALNAADAELVGLLAQVERALNDYAQAASEVLRRRQAGESVAQA